VGTTIPPLRHGVRPAVLDCIQPKVSPPYARHNTVPVYRIPSPPPSKINQLSPYP
jgi:hypothetical protein